MNWKVDPNKLSILLATCTIAAVLLVIPVLLLSTISLADFSTNEQLPSSDNSANDSNTLKANMLWILQNIWYILPIAFLIIIGLSYYLAYLFIKKPKEPPKTPHCRIIEWGDND